MGNSCTGKHQQPRMSLDVPIKPQNMDLITQYEFKLRQVILSLKKQIPRIRKRIVIYEKAAKRDIRVGRDIHAMAQLQKAYTKTGELRRTIKIHAACEKMWNESKMNRANVMYHNLILNVINPAMGVIDAQGSQLKFERFVDLYNQKMDQFKVEDEIFKSHKLKQEEISEWDIDERYDVFKENIDAETNNKPKQPPVQPQDLDLGARPISNNHIPIIIPSENTTANHSRIPGNPGIPEINLRQEKQEKSFFKATSKIKNRGSSYLIQSKPLDIDEMLGLEEMKICEKQRQVGAWKVISQASRKSLRGSDVSLHESLHLNVGISENNIIEEEVYQKPNVSRRTKKHSSVNPIFGNHFETNDRSSKYNSLIVSSLSNEKGNSNQSPSLTNFIKEYKKPEFTEKVQPISNYQGEIPEFLDYDFVPMRSKKPFFNMLLTIISSR